MTKTQQAPEAGELYHVDYDSLIPDPDNVRVDVGDISDLADSIAAVGLLSPLNTHPADEDGNFKIIAGHRRHAAIGKLIDEKRWAVSRPVPALIKENVTDESALADQLIENLHRADLNPIEEANGFLRLTATYKVSKADLSKKLARSSEYISRRIALLKLPEICIQQVREGRIHLDAAYALANLGDDAKVLALTNHGNRVPTDAQIDAAKGDIKAHKAEAAFTRWVTDMEIELMAAQDFQRTQRARIIIDTSEPSVLKTLTEKIPKNAFALITTTTWMGKATLRVWAPLTDAAFAKKQAEEQAEREKNNTTWELQQAEREKKRLDALPPEQAAWEAECAAARDAHREATAEWQAEQRQLVGAWGALVNSKDAARWAMMAVATFDPYNIVTQLDLTDADAANAFEVVANYCSVSAANLTQVVAVAMATDDQLDEEGVGDAMALLNSYRAKHGKPAPELHLPPSPGNPDSEEPMTEEEADAIRQVQDEAAEAVEEDYED